ncbi:MAG TPA: BamA/TamA family outer membrane protein, partial [Candidatus Kapabacteria bacterium]|nr:BamA/TamA family outer membrane protein [Candidatus Kapabacteria bacterium]
DFYHTQGYLDARITGDSIYYTEDSSRLNLRITESEGTKFYIRNIVFVGNTVYTEKELLDHLQFKKGDVYNTDKFERNLKGNEDQNDVSSQYLNNGYLTCQIDREETRVPPDSIDITVHIAEHSQYRIRQILIAGNSKTYDKVIRRELYTLPGRFFSKADVIRSIRQLSVLNYFNPEKIKPEPRMVDATDVDIVYNVEERSSDTFNASVGYSGSFGFTGSVGLSFNNFSIGSFLSDPFRYGEGQVLNLTYEHASGNTLNTFSLGFTEPWLWDTPTSVGFTIFNTDEIYSTFATNRYGVSLSVGRRFRIPDDFSRGDWTLQAQRNDVTQGGGYYRDGLTDEISVTQVLSRSSIDNAIFPSSGSRVAWLFQVAIPFDTNFVGFHKNKFTFEFFTPLLQSNGQGRLVLYTIADYGFMKEFVAGNIIQPLDYFFMGGNGLTGIPTVPLRGYPDQSVGPTSSNGVATGGRIYEKYGMELRFAVSLDPVPIYVLGFAEAGNVWADLRSVDPFGLKRSVGVGARLLINPIGLLGFDEGYGFDPLIPGGPPSGWNFHFQFGKGF